MLNALAFLQFVSLHFHMTQYTDTVYQLTLEPTFYTPGVFFVCLMAFAFVETQISQNYHTPIVLTKIHLPPKKIRYRIWAA